MARKVENKKGFKVIKLTLADSKAIRFGIPEGCICMHCNKVESENIYYICVLNDTMCEDCYKDFIETATYYKEDSIIEDRNYNYYKEQLSRKQLWEE